MKIYNQNSNILSFNNKHKKYTLCINYDLSPIYDLNSIFNVNL